jgi:tRNA-uridine 2-sulfurtransferase
VSNTVTIGPAEGLDVLEIEAARPVWSGCTPPAVPVDCLVQLRAHGEPQSATCEQAVGDGGGDVLRIRLHSPARGVARGQAAVLYDGDTVLGSATISGALQATRPG